MVGKWRSGDKQADRNQETNGNEETNSNKETEYKDSENRYRCGYKMCIRDRLMEKMERWEYLEELAEKIANQ